MKAPTRARRGRPALYPFESLKHGDSFEVPCVGAERGRVRARLSKVASTWHAHPDNFCRFTVKTVDTGVRVQRIA